jgi:hypothetical protein
MFTFFTLNPVLIIICIGIIVEVDLLTEMTVLISLIGLKTWLANHAILDFLFAPQVRVVEVSLA